MMTLNPFLVSRWHRCAPVVLAGLIWFASSAHGALHPWEKVEIVLTATRDYPNPYVDVEVWVELSGPGFTKRCYGFWDGGRTYRVRVVATAPGQWTWRSGSNQDDPGLKGKTGSFTATEWTEQEKKENPVRRGFVHATPNGHALQYADGTPYFIVGDYMYAASTWRYKWRDEDTDYPVNTDQGGFKDWVKYRRKQGFSMAYILTAFPGWSYDDGQAQDLKDKSGVCLREGWEHAGLNRAMNMQNEDGERAFFFPGKAPGYPDVCPDYWRINPAYFKYLDKKMDYANSQGFQVFLETLRRDIFGGMKAYYGFTDADPARNAAVYYIHYICARYQANAVVFGMLHCDKWSPLGPQDCKVPIKAHYEKYGHPPFGQLETMNIGGSTSQLYGNPDWLTMHQVGNASRNHDDSDAIENMFNLKNPKPCYNQEPYFIGSDSPGAQFDNRRTMYSCLLRGGLAGVAYEAQGQTRAVRETSKVRYHPLMWVSVTWNSANQAQHAGTFMLTHGNKYWDLVPHKELLSPAWNSTPYWAYCMRTDDKRLFKLYFEKNDARTDLSGALPNTAYKAQWLNPRTGAWTNVGDSGTLTSNADGVISIPPCPSAEDWCLSLWSKPTP